MAGQKAGSQGETRGAVDAIEWIGRISVEVDAIDTGIAAAMEGQGAATQEIARNVQEAAHGTFKVSGAITNMRQRADDAANSAVQVLGTASGLSRVSDALALTVPGSPGEVKAA